ncbi:CLUMA_CG001710, isoform A [Clunio marinus]|uniref:CLUMA_CG001710, isoform A n=1 Tax=Clunio marinus TaxID=568069 RepID=A0A1J1HKI6_9DIPT|nr:CLUMA_CG001710, isoform A [Clunio marinus]
MDRGGDNQGDIPELLEGAQLLNTIGIALNVHFSDPTKWTEEEMEEAEFGHLCFFKDDSRKAIDVIVNKISEESKGKDRFLITVLPIQLYSNEKLYSLSLFRFKTDSKWKFIDNVGRVYKDFQDWKENNVLPPGKVCYPLNGHLQRNCKGYVQTRCKSTPYGSNQSKVMKTADISTGVIGIVGAIGTVFLTGGAALPFVVAGVGSAIYTTTRSIYHLVDRGNHGQTLSPFENHETFSLWLGIGANVISFGAMGATIRLSTLAFQGKNISQTFRAFVNIINGTTLGVNSVAVANSLAYMAIHFEDMSPMDMLMQVASVAFWAKSVFSYKPASTIVKEIHNQVLNGYSTALGHAQDDFNQFRVKFNNDKQLVKFYFRYLKQGLDPAQVSDVLVEIYQMGAGAQFFSVDPGQMTVNINGHTFTMEFLMSIKSCNRQTVFNILGGMSEEETKSFNKLRSQIQDDVALFHLIAEVCKDHGINPEDAASSLITFWDVIDDDTTKVAPSIKLNKDASITLGNGFSFSINQVLEIAHNHDVTRLMKENLFHFSVEDAIKFNQLRKLCNDDKKFLTWISESDKMNIGNTVEVLMEIKSNETEDFKFFDMIKFEESSSVECGIININDILKVSIFFLAQLDVKQFIQVIQMAKTSEIVDGKLRKFHERIGSFRIQSEFNRNQAQEWFKEVTKKFTRITARYGQPKPKELNRIFHIKALLNRFSQNSQQEIINFVFTLNPKKINDFCACCDFAYTFLNNAMEKLSVELYKTQKNAAKSEFPSIRKWREDQVIHDIKNNCRVSKLEFAKHRMNVTRNKMFEKSPNDFKDGLSDKELLKSIVSRVKNHELIKFETDISATVQLYKRSKHDVKKFIDRANFIIKDSKSKSHVWRCQEGVTRIVEFIDSNGRVEVTKEFGNASLNTFIEYDH